MIILTLYIYPSYVARRFDRERFSRARALFSMDLTLTCARDTPAGDVDAPKSYVDLSENGEETAVEESLVGSMMAGVGSVLRLSSEPQQQPTAIKQKESEPDHTEDESSQMSSFTEQTRPTELKGQVRSESETCDEAESNQATSTSVEIVVKPDIRKETHEEHLNDVDEDVDEDGEEGLAKQGKEYKHAQRTYYQNCFYFRTADFCEQDADLLSDLLLA